MELIIYLLLKKNNILYYELYKKRILFYLIFSFVILIDLFFFLFYYDFFSNEIAFLLAVLITLPFIFFIKVIMKIKRENKKLIFYLEDLYKKNGQMFIGDYNYINKFLLENRFCTLNKDDFFIRSVSNQLDLICKKWSKELDEKV
ncbi:hypothetical protein [Gilliamella sp. BG7]|uniref:hypothetical protein n=1 Tax=unclassified Gilliamella TaxID=2685620 RepID=UPI003986B2ED